MDNSHVTKVTDKDLRRYVDIQRDIMNEKRLRMLIILSNKSKSWSELMHELDLRNPKLLHDHISALTAGGLIEKNKDGLYSITQFGRICIELNIAQMDKLTGSLDRRGK